MAELLVRAKPHWMDSLKQKDLDKMTVGQKQSYNARSQIGDIIVVRPDGWKWGKEECLPNFVVVKIPDLKFEDAQKFEENLQVVVSAEHKIERKDYEALKPESRTIHEITYTCYGEFVNSIPVIKFSENRTIKIRVERDIWDDVIKKQEYLSKNYYTEKVGGTTTAITKQLKDGSLQYLYEVEIDAEILNVEGEVFIMGKVRRHKIPETVVNNAKALSKSEISITSLQKVAFLNNIIKKVS